MYQQSIGGFMKLSGFAVKVIPAACAAGIMLSVGVLCQKPKGAETPSARPAVAAAVPAPQPAVAAADTSMKKADSAAMCKKVDTCTKAAEAGYYTCPMHPKIHQAKPGKCPICKMDLVFKKATAVKLANPLKKKK
jgi:hypothetical protein